MYTFYEPLPAPHGTVYALLFGRRLLDAAATAKAFAESLAVHFEPH